MSLLWCIPTLPVSASLSYYLHESSKMARETMKVLCALGEYSETAPSVPKFFEQESDSDTSSDTSSRSECSTPAEPEPESSSDYVAIDIPVERPPTPRPLRRRPINHGSDWP